MTPEEMDQLATLAAEKALNKVYAEVGKGVLRKLAWLAGVVVFGLAMWLAGRGYYKP